MLQPDQILCDRYQLQRRLGAIAGLPLGRQTWQARDLQCDPAEPVVVKLLAFSPELDWDQIKLFEREAQLLRSISHPALPTYRDSFSLAGSPLWMGLVQDYIPGESLAERSPQRSPHWPHPAPGIPSQLSDPQLSDPQLSHAPAPWGPTWDEANLRRLAAELLSILNDLHRLNPPLLHRDIKPSNILLGRDRRLYLIDWGAAQTRLPSNILGSSFTVVGTYGYAPLEQFGGRAVAASDLHALGATLIHLLTGICPADLPQENLQRQFEAPPQRPISPGFRRWLQTMTEPDYQRRYPSAADALSALRGLPAPASVQSSAQRGSSPSLVPRSQASVQPPLTAPHPSATHPPAAPPGSSLRLTRSPDLLLVETPGAEAGFVLATVGVFGCLAGLVSSPLLLAPGGVIGLAGLWFASPQVLRFERHGQQVYACWGKQLGGYLWQTTPPSGQPTSPPAPLAVHQVFHRIAPPVGPRTDQSSRPGQASRLGRGHRLCHSLLQFFPQLLPQHRRTLVIQTAGGETPIPTALSWQESHWLVAQIHRWLDHPEAEPLA